MPTIIDSYMITNAQGCWFANLMVGYVALLLLAAAPTDFQGHGTRASENPAAHAACAARWDTHLANNRRLVIMTWVGMLLQYSSGLMFIYVLRRLMPTPPVFESEAARERFIAVSARVIGRCSMVGKLLVRFVIPWVLLSHATYRCINQYQGAKKISFPALSLSCMCTLCKNFVCN